MINFTNKPVMDCKHYLVLVCKVGSPLADTDVEENNMYLYNRPPNHNHILLPLLQHHFHTVLLGVLKIKNEISFH